MVTRWDGREWKTDRVCIFDHNYARRPVNAKDPFYAFWANGDPANFSESILYFSNSDGSKVYELPYNMDTEIGKPRFLRK